MSDDATRFRFKPPVSERLGTSLALTFGGIMMCLIYAPMAWLVLMSFSAEPLGGIPGPFTLQWYRALFASPHWLDPLITSVLLGLAVAIACALASLLVARVVSQLRRRGLTMLLFLSPLFIPGILVGVAIFIYFRVILGLHMGAWSIFVAHFTWAYPFSLLALLINTLRFDGRLLEAGADLGASPWRRFIDIELPLIRPGIVASALFGFLLSFNELPRSLLLKGSIVTLPLFEWAQASAHKSNVPVIFSLSTLIMIASMIIIGTAFMLLFGRDEN